MHVNYDAIPAPSFGCIPLSSPLRLNNTQRRRRQTQEKDQQQHQRKWYKRGTPKPVTAVATVSSRPQRFHPRSETGSLLTWSQATSSNPKRHAISNITDSTYDDDDDSNSQYSDAQVVDVHDLQDVPAASERLGRACAEALDMKPSRAALALNLLPIIASCLDEGEPLFVAKWALNDAAYRCDQAALEELSVICSFSSDTFPTSSARPPQPAPEPLVRFVCAEMGSHSALAAATALRAAQKWQATEANKGTRVLRIHVPFAVAILGVICSLARAECEVFRRGRKKLGDIASLVGRSGRARVTVDIVGSEPAVVVVHRQGWWFGGKDVREQGEELVAEVTDVLSEFASVAVLGR